MFYCIHVLFYSISLCPILLYYVLLCLFHFIIIFYFILFFYYFVTIKVFSSKMFYSIPYHSVKIYSIIFSSSIVFYWPLSSFRAATAELSLMLFPAVVSNLHPAARQPPPSPQPLPILPLTPSLPPALPQWEQRCGSQTSEVLLVWWPRLHGACGQQVQIQGNHKC